MAPIVLASEQQVERRSRSVTAVSGARIGTPAVASSALEPLLGGGATRARILGVSNSAVWMATPSAFSGEGCVVVATSDAVRLPNEVVIAATTAEQPFAGVSAGESAMVGDGKIMLGRLAIRPVRWWNPRPVLSSTRAEALEGRVAAVRARLTVRDESPFAEALVAGDVVSTGRIAAVHLGGGTGLTPYNDDVVGGALATARLLAEALGEPATTRANDLLERTAATLLPIAAARTTIFSAALLRHAARGEVAEPVARLLHALTGWGNLDDAVDGLLSVGHSSGLGLASGILIGADATLASWLRV